MVVNVITHFVLYIYIGLVQPERLLTKSHVSPAEECSRTKVYVAIHGVERNPMRLAVDVSMIDV